MKEDIKILEEICERPIKDTEGTIKMKQALEHLLQAYKEQEQIIDEMAYDIFTVFKPELVLKYGIENVKEFKEMFINKVKENKE